MSAKKKAKTSKPAISAGAGRQCEVGMCKPQRVQGLKTDLKNGSTHELISIRGPGLFLAGHVSKQGGTNDLTFVDLQIDGKNVVNLSFAAAGNLGLTQNNPYGLVLLKGGLVQNFTFGWQVPLTFHKSLELSVVVNESGVAQIIGNVVHGSTG